MTPSQIILGACLVIVGAFYSMVSYNQDKETKRQQQAQKNLESLKHAPVAVERRRGTIVNEIV